MIDELSLGYTKELQQDAAATGTPEMKLSVCKCQAHMGALGCGQGSVQLDYRIKTQLYDP
jgi:hypothetical protein